MAGSPQASFDVYPAHELDALDLAGRRRVTRWFGRMVLIALLLLPALMLFAPWQQNLAGSGRVIEFDPVDRPMPLQARTDGLLERWHVREGQQVRKGDPILDLIDNDPLIIERLGEQVAAAENKLSAARRKVEHLESQLVQADLARTAAIQYADDEIAAAEQAVTVAEQAEAVATERLKLAEIAAEMWAGLVKDRIGAGFELQKAEQDRNIAAADVASRKAAVSGKRADLRAKQSARERTLRAEQVKVDEVNAKLEEAKGDVADAEGSLPKLRRDLDRQRQQRITAPVDGYVQNLVQNGQGGGFVKQGMTVATLIPVMKQPAVELWIDGNDITFIQVGRHVRLQFEGWPAIQWVGWPSAAVGTFGGQVAFIDRADDGTGRFRVMVLPDERPFAEPEGPLVDWLRKWLTFDETRSAALGGNPHAWPGAPYLRQGVRAKGWIVLDRVSLGFEIWRQLNGFPPMIARPTDKAGSQK